MTTPIYIQNKYYTWYHNIIRNAQSQDRIKNNGTYYENHHIIPKSFSGNNQPENLVLLTAKEHFICHALLIRFTTGQYNHKMIYAFDMMCKIHQHPNSRLYESNKIKVLILRSENMKGNKIGVGNKSQLGKHHTKTTKEQMSKSKLAEKNHWYNGDYHTPYGIFTTAKEAAISLISSITIIRWCKKHPDKIISNQSISASLYLQQLPESPLGKTFREIGFYFLCDLTLTSVN